MSLWKIYRVFAEMGAVCFGGGYAMLSLVQRVIVEEHGWATEEELMDYYAIGPCTPGVIAVNVSTFIGHKLRGIPGAIVASLGFISPSILIITLIAAFLESFASNVYVAHALAGRYAPSQTAPTARPIRCRAAWQQQRSEGSPCHSHRTSGTVCSAIVGSHLPAQGTTPSPVEPDCPTAVRLY